MRFTEAEAEEMIQCVKGGRKRPARVRMGDKRWDKLAEQLPKKRDNSEDWLSAAVNMWLDLPEVQLRGMAFHVPNETASKGEAGRKKWLGVKAGVADWIFTGPPLVAIELKVEGRKQTPAQREWGEGLEAGWGANFAPRDKEVFAPRYRVCRSLRDVAMELVEACLVNREPALLRVAVEKVRTWFAVQHGREIP